MLTVIKRLGNEEAFNIKKIINSLAAASDEMRQPLCESDINNLASSIQKFVDGLEKTGVEVITSRELFDITIDAMKGQGFTELSAAYKNSIKNDWT